MARVWVWLRLLVASACFVGCLWMTADGRFAHPYEWPTTVILLVIGVALVADATVYRVRIAITRHNEQQRRRKDD